MNTANPTRTLWQMLALMACAGLTIMCGLVLLGRGSLSKNSDDSYRSTTAIRDDSAYAAPEILADFAADPDYRLPPIEGGLAPIVNVIPTMQKVVFLTIDDGQSKQAFQLDLLKKHNIRASLFLADIFIRDNPAYFKPFVAAGMPVEDHTVHHSYLPGLSYPDQVQEICSEANSLQKTFGHRPTLFRPPGGDYNHDTRRAAAACGMRAVVLWSAKANGGSMQYQVGNSLRPGDIVLMHFRPEFAHDVQAFVDAQQAAGLRTVLLERWLTDRPIRQ